MSNAPHLQLVASTPAPAAPPPLELPPLPSPATDSSWVHVFTVAIDLIADAARAHDVRREQEAQR
jgi:hypothetical protein